MLHEKLLIIDFGSQYTQLIARKIREQKVFCVVSHPEKALNFLKKDKNIKGIVLSGGPSSIYDKNAPKLSSDILEQKIPILGICYGEQFIASLAGAKVTPSSQREYGHADLEILDKEDLFFDIQDNNISVWMSHGDRIENLPSGFEAIGKTKNACFAAIADKKRKIYGVQFHPEVTHTKLGKEILSNFLFRICECNGDWQISDFIEEQIADIKNTVGNDQVVCGLSGGVDSSVAAVLIHKAIGKKLNCIFVDNGLLREGEKEEVEQTFTKNIDINLTVVDAEARFLEKLKDVTDPEQKRKIIGKEFIDVFTERGKELKNVKFLAQGTLYPDVIESVSVYGPSATIKSHHNVGGLPEKMHLKLIEPLRELFKDEVREIGKLLGLPEKIIKRQPFPGPGLAVRIVGKVTEERLALVRKADKIINEEIESTGTDFNIWQSFAVLLPVKSVGVMGDFRTYENVCAIRAVQSVDGMTADWVKLPYDLLSRISNRIINEVRGINRVTYDISSKPPATIEWE